MKKIIVFIISLFLVGCTTTNLEKTVCINTVDQPIKIEREITLIHRDNEITSIDSLEKMFFSGEFTKEMFDKLIVDMQERHQDSKNLTLSDEVFDEYAAVTISLKDLDNASVPELMLVGIELEDDEFVPGLTETVRLNERNGYTCKIIAD